jgi:CRP/FNR family transcriptional regulator, cyclic AMP receptor protein
MTSDIHANLYAALVTSGILRRTDPDVAWALTERVQTLNLRAGHQVITQGEENPYLYIIVSGKVKVTFRSHAGGENVLSLLGPTDVVGMVSLFEPGAPEYSVTALTDVVLGEIARDQLAAWMVAHPEIGHQMLRLLARRVEFWTSYMFDIVFTDVPYRLAQRLLVLSKQFGQIEYDAVRVIHDMTIDEIAQLSGAAPKTVCAALHDFAEQGWIRLEEDSVVIVDAGRLADLPPRSTTYG